MIVCHCHGIRDRVIRKAAREGARSLRQIARISCAGRMCGGCLPLIRQLIAEERGTAPDGPEASGRKRLPGTLSQEVSGRTRNPPPVVPAAIAIS